MVETRGIQLEGAAPPAPGTMPYAQRSESLLFSIPYSGSTCPPSSPVSRPSLDRFLCPYGLLCPPTYLEISSYFVADSPVH